MTLEPKQWASMTVDDLYHQLEVDLRVKLNSDPTAASWTSTSACLKPRGQRDTLVILQEWYSRVFSPSTPLNPPPSPKSGWLEGGWMAKKLYCTCRRGT